MEIRGVPRMSRAAMDTGFSSAAACERAIKVEQVRLVYQRIRATQWAMLVLAIAITWVFRAVGIGILLWLALHVLLKVAEFFELRWFATEAEIAARPHALARRLIVGQAIHAAAWGLLAIVALPTATAQQFILVFMIMAGIASGSVTAFAPLLPVFTAYVAILTLVLDLMLVLGKLEIAAGYMPLFVTIYGAAMWVKARDEAIENRRSILLAFTNAAFSRNLEHEIERSEAAETEAVSANMAKTRFLAAASHDLRQPLAALGLFLGVLEQDAADERQRATTRSARAAFAATTEMLDELLDFSRAEAGVIEPRPRPFLIGEAFARLEHEVGPMADARGLDYRTRSSAMIVDADPALVHIILLNLLSNAVRYTEKGGVLIGCRSRGNDVVVEIWDSGIGIPPEQHDEIFREFHQLGNVERDRRKGLGLGLAIARRIADLIGGELSVASRVGRGSVFRLRLRRSAVSVVPPAAAEAEATDFPVAGPGDQRPRVLVLDDDEAIGLGMHMLLGGWGYDCRVAETLAEALAVVRAWPPAALICDLRLRGEENGLEAVRQLRARLGEVLPAFIMTGDTHPDRLREAAQAAVTVIHKPVTPETLQRALRETLGAERSDVGA